MGHKIVRNGVLLLLGGVAWSCVNPAVIDSGEGDENGLGGSVAGLGGSVSGVGGSANPGSAGGETGEVTAYCPINEEVPYDPASAYPFCQLPTGVSPADAWRDRCRYTVDIGGGKAGQGALGWTSGALPDGQPMDLCLCTDYCQKDEDCGSPETGDAAASCVSGQCAPTCDGGEACPEGMICSLNDELGHHICGWGIRGEGCNMNGWPEVTDKDPMPVCPLNDEVIHNPEQPYAYCQADSQGPGQDYCGYQQAKFWEPSHTDDCFNCDACFCQTTCVGDSDCLEGETGTATARCMKGACVLSCNDDESCPDGMTCTTTYGGDKKVCGWVSGNGGCDESKFNF